MIGGGKQQATEREGKNVDDRKRKARSGWPIKRGLEHRGRGDAEEEEPRRE